MAADLVLAHRPATVSRQRCNFRSSVFRSFRSSLLLVLPILLAKSVLSAASAQTVVRGQVYTAALAIVDAPQPSSQFHAGSDLTIAIDVSGDGKLPSSATTPGSGLSTHFDSLELYLVSVQTGSNMTVSSGGGLLSQEPGSTVKHVDFALPSCIAPGAYNLTVYEGSTINGQAFYSITPIPISIDNTSPSGAPCSGLNALAAQPQPDSAPAQNPWLNNAVVAVTTDAGAPQGTTAASVPAPSDAPSSGFITVTVGPSGVMYPYPAPEPTPTSSGADNTVTLTMGGEDTSTLTMVVASFQTQTVTATLSGQPSTWTTTRMSLSTTTAVVYPSGASNSGAFFPVNAATTQARIGLGAAMCTSALATVALLNLYLS